MASKGTKGPVNLPAVIKPGATVQEIVTAFLSLASNATPDTVIQACALITDDDAREKVFLLALLGAVCNKAVTSACVQALGLVLPAEWESKSENGKINFTNFAMLGHMVFMHPVGKTGNVVNQFRPAYEKSLGGSKDLMAFGTTGTVPGKSTRQGILREWAGRFGNYNPASHEKDLRTLFSGVFGHGASSPAAAAASNASKAPTPAPSRFGWHQGRALIATLVGWSILFLFGGPIMFLKKAGTPRRRVLLIAGLLTAHPFGLDSLSYQESCISRITTVGFRAANISRAATASGIRVMGRVVPNPRAKEVLKSLGEGVDAVALQAEPFLGEAALRSYASIGRAYLVEGLDLGWDFAVEAFEGAKGALSDAGGENLEGNQARDSDPGASPTTVAVMEEDPPDASSDGEGLGEEAGAEGVDVVEL